MKILLVSVLALCFARPNTDFGQRAPLDDPPPPPIDCPMCGGNAEAHKRQTSYLIGLQATLLLRSSISSSAPL